MAIFVLIIITCLTNPVFTMIGYDCGTSASNITTISLLDVEECDIPIHKVNVTEQYIQLLQLNEYSETQVIQCKIEIFRTIDYCGAFSHTAVVDKAQMEYIETVSRDACRDMHKFGTTRIAQTIMTGIEPNRTTRSSIMLAGHATNEGTCSGASYSDPYGTWDNVIVQGVVSISLQSYTAKVSLESNLIYLRSGTVCALLDTTCQDSEGGDTFWDARPRSDCKLDQYGILFNGIANKIKEVESDVPRTIYSLTSSGVTFALSSRETDKICGYSIISTEHPKLFIFETTPANSFATKGKISVANPDIFSYVNSKFVYVERLIRQEMKSLYHDLLKQQCNTERQMLQNSLSIASQAPDEFAYRLMKGPGYMAVLAGEVVHIIKCVPVEVSLLRLKDCYNQLPVTRGNESFFLSPRTHILSKKGTQITCNDVLPSYYFSGDVWYKLTTVPVEAVPPQIMKPMTKSSWQYTNPASFATSGIYTKEDIDKLRERIMFPFEKPAVLNNLVRGINGQHTVNQGERFVNLLDESSLYKIAESAWEHTWGQFVQFGTISAGLIGIMLTFRAFKLVIDTVIHGYALHTIYGWSIYPVGAVWDSVTHLLIHLAMRPDGDSSNDVEKQLELNDYQESIEPQPNRCQLHGRT